MIFKKKKNKYKSIFVNQISFALLGLLLVMLISVPLAKNISQQYKVNNEIKELQSEIHNLENKNLELNNLISYLESDEFIDEQARLKLNYKKEGEEVAVIKDGSEDNAVSESSTNNLNIFDENNNVFDKKLTNPLRWWHYFFNS